MGTDYKPTVVGSPEQKAKTADPEKAIEKLETDLKEQAESLRKIRTDYIRGVITEAEMEKIEAKFTELLMAQRQVLQNLRASLRGRNG